MSSDRSSPHAPEIARLRLQASAGLAIERQLWSEIGIKAPADILDVGCGPGAIAYELAKLVNPGRVVGIDRNPEQLNAASQTPGREAVNLTFRDGDIYSLGQDIGTFDWIHARFVFQHLNRPIEALESLKRRMKKDGRICIVDIDDQWLTMHPEPELLRPYIECVGASQKQYGGDRRIGSKLYSLLDQAGFRDIQIFVKVITSAQLGMDNFIQIVTGFSQRLMLKHSGVAVAGQFANIDKEIKRTAKWGCVALFCATARHP